MTTAKQVLIDKIKQLPPQRVAEVENFVDCLLARMDGRHLTHAAAKAGEASFAQAWGHEGDAADDRMWLPMANASRFSFGDVVLVLFPFADQSGTKKRPVVVVSSPGDNASRRDIVIMAITSRVHTPLGFGEALAGERGTGRFPQFQATAIPRATALKAAAR